MKRLRKKSKELSISINENPQDATRQLSNLVIELIKDSGLSNEVIRTRAKLSTSSYYYGLLENKFYNFKNSLVILKALNYDINIKIK